jgi:hypothetical protein
MSSLKEADSSVAQRKERITNDTILPAARMWCEDSEAATRTYGHISEWDVSECTLTLSGGCTPGSRRYSRRLRLACPWNLGAKGFEKAWNRKRKYRAYHAQCLNTK